MTRCAPPVRRTTEREALILLLDEHRALRRDLDEIVRTLRVAARTHSNFQGPLAALISLVRGRLLPHAAADDVALYPAATRAGAPLLVEAMRAEHRALEETARGLETARFAVDALGAAERLAGIFAVHMDKENDIVLPLLDRTPDVSLSGILTATDEHE